MAEIEGSETDEQGLRRSLELLRTWIRGGQLAESAVADLPSLADSIGQSLSTTEAAVMILLDQGMLRRIGGGLRFGPRMGQIPTNERALGDPAEPGTRFDSGLRVAELEHQVVQSTPIIRDRLQTDAEHVLMVEQIGRFDEQPIYVHVGYYAEDDPHRLSRLITEADQGPQRPMHVVFERLFHAALSSCETTVEAVRSDAVTAGILGIPVGTPT